MNQGQETYPIEDVLHFFASDPFAENGHLLGSGHAAKMHAQVLRAMDGFLNNFVEKGAIKATILGVRGGENIPPDEQKNLLLSKVEGLLVTGWFKWWKVRTCIQCGHRAPRHWGRLRGRGG